MAMVSVFNLCGCPTLTGVFLLRLFFIEASKMGLMDEICF